MPASKKTASKAKPSKAKTSKAKTSKAKVAAGKCSGWKAVLNMMPPGPWVLRVTGNASFRHMLQSHSEGSRPAGH